MKPNIHHSMSSTPASTAARAYGRHRDLLTRFAIGALVIVLSACGTPGTSTTIPTPVTAAISTAAPTVTVAPATPLPPAVPAATITPATPMLTAAPAATASAGTPAELVARG